MSKTHFGDATIGALCSKGMKALADMTLRWSEVDCLPCQRTEIPAAEIPDEVVQTWLASRVERNEKMREWHAEKDAEWASRRQAEATKETATLHGLQHDIQIECPGDGTVIEKVGKRPQGKDTWSYQGALLRLKVQSHTLITDAVEIIVLPWRRWGGDQGIRCTIFWRDLIATKVDVDYWGKPYTINQPVVDQNVAADQVVDLWKQGSAAALARFIALRDTPLEEALDDEDEVV